MELLERLNEIRKIFTRRKTIELKPTIQSEEVNLLEQKYRFQLPEKCVSLLQRLEMGLRSNQFPMIVMNCAHLQTLQT